MQRPLPQPAAEHEGGYANASAQQQRDGSPLSPLAEESSRPTDASLSGKPRKAPKAADAGATTVAAARAPTSTAAVPSHKVGRHVVYSHYPEAYDVLMARHDCAAVAAAIQAEAEKLLSEQSRTTDAATTKGLQPSNRLRVADLGCGTGRLALMALPWTATLVATDAATPMLRRFRSRLMQPEVGIPPSDIAVDCGAASAAGTTDEAKETEQQPQASTTTADKAEVRFRLVTSPFENFAPHPVQPEPACPCAECAASSAALAAGATPSESAVSTASAPPSANLLRPAPGYDLVGPRGDSSGGSRFDLVMCGWSLSFLMTAQWGNTRWHDAMFRCVRRMAAAVDPARGGSIVIVETLGNFSEAPVRNNSLHTYLEKVLGFERQWCRTDYRFADAAEAAKLVTFFFGSKVAERLAGTADPATLLECTGIWTKRIPASER